VRQFTLRLSIDQEVRLDAISVETNTSKADVIRMAVDHYCGVLAERADNPVTAKLNPRMHELIEFTAMAMDHILSDRYGDQIRDDILTDVSQNLRKFHA
jgi:hypothetical protein